MQAILLREKQSPAVINQEYTSMLDFCYKYIGCDCIEIVHPRRLSAPYLMVVDDEGLLKEAPLNYIASYLYETDKHGQPIVGTALIMKETMTNDGPDLCSLTDVDVAKLLHELPIIRQ